MIRPFACFTLVLIALLAWPNQTKAAESYDNCTGFIDSLPAVITTQGTWCLRKDLSTAMTSGNAIDIATNNVTLDCNDFKIGGLAAGLETLAQGVRATDRFNTTVRHCRIRGFRIGVALVGQGGGHKVEDNTLEGSRSVGMIVLGAGSVVRGNRVIDSGGSTVSALGVAGIQVAGGVDVIDNLVRGVRSFRIEFNDDVISGDATGIHAQDNNGGSIIGNRVSGAVPGTAAQVRGFGIRIQGINQPNIIIVSGNILKGGRSSAFKDTAIACSGDGTDAVSTDNVLVGFTLVPDGTELAGCSQGDNSINTN